MKKLAIRIDTSGTVPMGGNHYMLHPVIMADDFEARSYYAMGHTIVEVEDAEAERLVKEAGQALAHQIEVANLTMNAWEPSPINKVES